MVEQPWPLPPPQRTVEKQSKQRAGQLFVDATDDLRQRCSDLALGQMVHPSSFTMLDTMTSISILDPRMDSGIYPPPQGLVPESDRIPRDTLPTFDARTPLTVVDILWIMDRLMACEVAFYESAPLSQTLFTCLLYHSIEEMGISANAKALTSIDTPHEALSGFVLRGYIIATIKCFGLTWQELIKGNIIEGEDATTDTCNLSLLDDLPVQTILDELEEVIAWLDADALPHLPHQRGLVGGLIERLRFRKTVLTTLALFSDALSDGRRPGASSSNNPFLHPSSSMTLFQLSQLSIQMADHIERLSMRSVDLKSAPSPQAASVFEPSYSRRLQNAGGPPSRAVELPNEESVVEFWQKLTTGWKQAAGVYRTATMGIGNKWEVLTSFLEVTGVLALERPSCAYMRSLLQSCLCPPSHPQPALLADFWSSSISEPSYIFSRAKLDLERILDSTQPISGRGGTDFTSKPPTLDPQSFRWWAQKGESLLGNYLVGCMSNHSRAKRSVGRFHAEWMQWVADGQHLQDELNSISNLPGVGEERRLEEIRRVFAVLNAANQVETNEIGLFLVMSGFDLDLYAMEERPIAYWLAHRISSKIDQGRREMLKTLPRGTFWRTKTLAVWEFLSWSSNQTGDASKAQGGVPGWTFTSSHRKAIFKRRFKWLRLPTRDSHGQGQDPDGQLNQLWNEWEHFISLRRAVDEKDLSREVRRMVEEAREEVEARGVELTEGKKWALCRAEAQMLNSRLLSSIEAILLRLPLEGKEDVNSHDIHIPPPSSSSSAQVQLPHPWFPPMELSTS